MPPSVMSLFTRAYAIAPLVLCAAAIGWSGNTIAGRMAAGEISPMLLVFLRWLFVVTLLVALNGRAMVEVWPVMRPRLPWVIFMGATGLSFFNGLFYVSAHYTSGVNMAIIQGALPAMILIGSFFVFGSRIGIIQILGVLIAIAGVLMIATGGSFTQLLALDFNRGDIGMLVTCSLYAVFTLGLKVRPQVGQLVLFSYMASAALVISVPMVLTEHFITGLVWPGLKGWLIIAFVVVWPSLLSQIFFMRGVDLVGPGNAGLYVNTVPVFASALAIILLGEAFHFHHILAMLLVFTGIYLFESRKAVR